MKIPNKIKIGSHWYSVKFADLDKIGGNDEPGISYLLKNKIFINTNNNISRSQQEQTLIHEIIEAINYNYELSLPHQSISILGETIYQVLNDNKFLR